MSALAFLLLATVITLGVCLFLARHRRRRDSDGEAYGMEHQTVDSFEWDLLVSELSGRIFDPEDSRFVASETFRHTVRQFRRERTALALEWLRAIRHQVNQLMRNHFRASRVNDGINPADEAKLWFEFLLFQLTSGILYLVVWVGGPLRASALLRYSIEMVAEVRKVTEEVLPAGRHVAAEFVNAEREAKN